MAFRSPNRLCRSPAISKGVTGYLLLCATPSTVAKTTDAVATSAMIIAVKKSLAKKVKVLSGPESVSRTRRGRCGAPSFAS